MRPLALDLCCGLGGWAEGLIAAGWDVVGVDIDERFRATYPGLFVCCDIRWLAVGEWIIDEAKYRTFGLAVASPPCQEFSRHDQPWTKRRNPPPPDKSIWEACILIAEKAGAPLILENVRGAQQFMGSGKWHFGSRYLWGDVPAIMPKFSWAHERKKESRTSAAVAERSKIPFELALHIGRVFHPGLEGVVA